MIILKPIENVQTVKFIGRDLNADGMSFRDDQTNITVNFDLRDFVTIYPNHREISFTFDKTTLFLIEGHTYDFRVYDFDVKKQFTKTKYTYQHRTKLIRCLIHILKAI